MRATFSCRPEACPLPPSHGLPSSFPPWPVLTRPQAGSSSPPSLVLEPYGAGAWLLEPGRPGRGATARVLDSVSLCQEKNFVLPSLSVFSPVCRQVSSWEREVALHEGHIRSPQPLPDAPDTVATV